MVLVLEQARLGERCHSLGEQCHSLSEPGSLLRSILRTTNGFGFRASACVVDFNMKWRRYIRGIWRSLISLLVGVNLRNTLLIIIHEGVISTQTSTNVLASKYIFQRAMIITDELLNISIS